MKVAVVQFEPVFGEIARNIATVTKMIADIEAELFVLPELCFTGYSFRSLAEAEFLAENPESGLSISKMKELAATKRSAVIFGFAEKADGGLFNSAAFVSPDRRVHVYRKLHLFLNEKDWFLPGNRTPEVFEFRGARLGIMVCFDWIFPETARCLALKGAHIICHPANLVMPYCQAAMITRSLENRVFSITANRIGEEKRDGYHNRFTGQSQIVNPQGDILFRASNNKEEVGVADIKYEESDEKAVNLKNNLWDDRRPELY